jgi:MarR family 2-MHQ and catechol resistance regulon transcriptional repressor
MVSSGSERDAAEVDALHQLAMRYMDEVPWADLAALEAYMSILGTAASLRQGLNHFIAPLGFGLGAPRFLVLRALYLAEERRLSLGTIAQAINVTSTNVTSLVDGLERDGWVERLPNPNDRRMTYARLTPAGEQRCARLIPAVADFTGAIFKDFSDEEKVLLNALLARVPPAIETALLSAGAGPAPSN